MSPYFDESECLGTYSVEKEIKDVQLVKLHKNIPARDAPQSTDNRKKTMIHKDVHGRPNVLYEIIKPTSLHTEDTESDSVSSSDRATYNWS